MHRILSVSILLLCSLFAFSQSDEEYRNRNYFALVYTNFYFDVSENPDNMAAFEVRRVYFGYKASLNKNFSAEVKTDIGSPGDVSQYALLRRFAYFRTACMHYQNETFTWSFGLLDLTQYKFQEKFWGYRYIYKSFQDEHSYGHSADLGTVIQYKASKMIHFDAAISNGEGASRTQTDNYFKYAAGISFQPIEALSFRTYYDILKREDECSQTFSFFSGLRHKTARLGAEFVYKPQTIENKEFNRFGYSLFSAITFKKKYSAFARFDHTLSNIPEGYSTPWNLQKDGSSIIAGLEYMPHEKVRLSLNYQDWVPYANNLSDYANVFFNIEFAF